MISKTLLLLEQYYITFIIYQLQHIIFIIMKNIMKVSSY